MSIWNEEKTKVYVNSSACVDWWEPSTGLLGAITEYQLNEGYELIDSLNNVILNSPYCTWYHLARKNSRTKLLGDAIGTDLDGGLSLDFIKSYLSLKGITYTSVESFGINAFLPIANVYNELVDNYSFVLTSGSHTQASSTGSGMAIKREYIGTVQYQGDTAYVTSVGFNNSTDKQCYIYAYTVSEEEATRMESNPGGAVYPVKYTRLTFTDIKIPLSLAWTQSQFLYVSYYDSNNTRRVYAENMDNTSEILQKEYDNKKDIQYPTLTARWGGQDIRTQNKEFFKQTCKMTRRTNLQWEDLVPQVNGDLSDLNKPTDKDKEYAKSINGDCKNIFLTLACDVAGNSPYIKEYLYKLWKHVYFKNTGFILAQNQSGGELGYSCHGYHHYIKYGKITYEKKKGKICKWHKYATKGDVTKTTIDYSIGQDTIKMQKEIRTLHCYYQVEKDYYYEITVENPVHYTDAFNQDKSTQLPEFDNTKDVTKAEIRKIVEARQEADDDDDLDDEIEDLIGNPSEFVVPLFPVIVRQMGALRGGVLIQISLRFVWEVKKKIKKKWYQSTIFSVIRYIVYAVVLVVTGITTGGTGTAAALKSMATIQGLLEVAIQVLLSLAIKLAVKLVCKIFHLDKQVEAMINAIIDTARAVYAAYSEVPASDMVAMSIGNSIATMVITKNFSFEMFADMVGGAATAGLGSMVASNSIAAGATNAMATLASASVMTTFTLATSPGFYQALNTHKWNQAILQGALAIASSAAMAHNFVANAGKGTTPTISSEDMKMGGNALMYSSFEAPQISNPLDVFKQEFTKGMDSVMTARNQEMQKRYSSYESKMEKLQRRNSNLDRVERMLTAHNNGVVLKMLVNQQLYESQNELINMYTFV